MRARAHPRGKNVPPVVANGNRRERMQSAVGPDTRGEAKVHVAVRPDLPLPAVASEPIGRLAWRNVTLESLPSRVARVRAVR